MKKIIAITLCSCILFTGCATTKEAEKDLSDIGKENNIDSDSKDKPDDKPGNDSDNISDNKSDDSDDLKNLKLNKEWTAVTLTGVSQPDYNKPVFDPGVEQYVIEKDLSNIENINQFSGFSNEQKKMLLENGFVVLPSDDTRMYYVYDSNEYLGVPNFITTDSVLHLYHQFYDKSLMSIESDYLYDDLDNLTKQMLDKSIRLWEALNDEELIVLQERNIIYFLVARMIMLESSALDMLEVEVNEELYNIAKEEYQRIEKAEGFIKSPYLGYDFDYSQFTVRGHYSRSENLGRFFKTMMWFGTAALPFDIEASYDNVYQSLLMSFTTFLDTDYISNAQLWNNIYQPTEQYVGVSDDINVFMMNGLRMDVFGEAEDPNIFNDEEYKEKLEQAVLDLPEPKIQGKFSEVTTPTKKQFRYMGQRYILDSFIMQVLMKPILRPLPSALDTMGVLGSEFAEDLLFNYYKPQELWPEYEEKYYLLKDEVSSLIHGVIIYIMVGYGL